MNETHTRTGLLRRIIPTTLLGVAAATVVGLIGFSTPTVASADADPAVKRDEDVVEIVLVDDDDDDTNRTRGTRTRGGATNDATNDATGDSRSRNDNTNSRFTAVSRDRDVSRGDLTKDFTRDGGDRTRDWTKNATNDRSRNDTRGGR
ncbi:hypothetical protein KLP28_09285 [Nocardioidaceae bacterium]|nr:hypothetical protein KLP28_09285 [Nocardioidaceae bacterium]